MFERELLKIKIETRNLVPLLKKQSNFLFIQFQQVLDSSDSEVLSTISVRKLMLGL